MPTLVSSSQIEVTEEVKILDGPFDSAAGTLTLPLHRIRVEGAVQRIVAARTVVLAITPEGRATIAETGLDLGPTPPALLAAIAAAQAAVETWITEVLLVAPDVLP